MDFLKKHYDKITLAAALVILIGSALYLFFKVSSLSEEVQSAPYRPKPKGKVAQPVDLNVYSNAMLTLEQPAQWSDQGTDPFQRIGTIISPTPDVTTTNLVATDPVILLKISREIFKLKFVSYIGTGQNFQLNFVDRARTFFVDKVGMPVAGLNEQTGYKITNFERKLCTNSVSGIGEREVDCSELTLEHEGEKPIVLVLDKIGEEREPIAALQCASGGKLMQVRRQQTFDCSGLAYYVVDISARQVIIRDVAAKKEIKLNLPEQSGTPLAAQ